MDTSDKIVHAVLTCVTFCKDARAPRTIARLFLKRLAAEPGWKVEEIEEIKCRINERLPPFAARRIYE